MITLQIEKYPARNYKGTIEGIQQQQLFRKLKHISEMTSPQTDAGKLEKDHAELQGMGFP